MQTSLYTFSPFSNFIQGDSFLHKLDPRTKIVGLIAVLSGVIFVNEWIKLIPLVLLVIIVNVAAKFNLKQILANIFSFWLFLLIVIVLHGFLSRENVLINLPFGLGISLTGVKYGLFYSIKIILILGVVSPVLRTTHQSDWVNGISGFIPRPNNSRSRRGKIAKKLNHLAFTLGLSFRFLPLLMEESERIYAAQIGRGLEIKGGLASKTKFLIPVILPLISSSLRKAELIQTSMSIRGLNLDRRRTNIDPLAFQRMDFVAAAVMAVCMVLIVLL